MKTTTLPDDPDARGELTQPAGIEDMLLFRLSKVVSLGGSIVTRICEGQFGISRREWTVLAILARSEAMTWSDAAKRCELDDARLSRAVSSLVSKKFVRKTHAPPRQLTLTVTEEGRALYDAIFPVAREVNAQMLEVLDEHLAQALSESLSRLHRRGEEMVRTIPVPKARRSRGGLRDK